jgi:hypothetical protein
MSSEVASSLLQGHGHDAPLELRYHGLKWRYQQMEVLCERYAKELKADLLEYSRLNHEVSYLYSRSLAYQESFSLPPTSAAPLPSSSPSLTKLYGSAAPSSDHASDIEAPVAVGISLNLFTPSVIANVLTDDAYTLPVIPLPDIIERARRQGLKKSSKAAKRTPPTSSTTTGGGNGMNNSGSGGHTPSGSHHHHGGHGHGHHGGGGNHGNTRDSRQSASTRTRLAIQQLNEPFSDDEQPSDNTTINTITSPAFGSTATVVSTDDDMIDDPLTATGGKVVSSLPSSTGRSRLARHAAAHAVNTMAIAVTADDDDAALPLHDAPIDGYPQGPYHVTFHWYHYKPWYTRQPLSPATEDIHQLRSVNMVLATVLRTLAAAAITDSTSVNNTTTNDDVKAPVVARDIVRECTSKILKRIPPAAQGDEKKKVNTNVHVTDLTGQSYAFKSQRRQVINCQTFPLLVLLSSLCLFSGSQ